MQLKLKSHSKPMRKFTKLCGLATYKPSTTPFILDLRKEDEANESFPMPSVQSVLISTIFFLKDVMLQCCDTDKTNQ